jgi:mRNA-degrading endonuclease toxin of MazEF toxin-antitoxin module
MKKREHRRAQPPDGALPEPLIVRGDILWICCDPSVGTEPRKTRTCVVVSNNIANRFGQAITVVPTQAYSAERAERGYMADLRHPRSRSAKRALPTHRWS